MVIDLTKLLTALLEVALSLIIMYLIPYVKNYINEKTTAEQQEKLRMWVKIAVQAAEMIFKEAGMGVEKFQYVSQFIKDQGFEINDEELKVLIESAVLELKNAIIE